MVKEKAEIRSLMDLKKRLLEIKEMGWIKSRRKHDTGVGKTFEELLGVKENNIQLPDIGGIEVKSSREYTESLVTLITFEPPLDYRNINWTLGSLVSNFGQTGSEYGGSVFHITIRASRYTNNVQQFKLEIKKVAGEEMICIITKKKFKPVNSRLPSNVVACYPIKEIIDRIRRKLSGCLLVIEAESQKFDNTEKFKLKNAKLYVGFSVRQFIELVKRDKILLDIRFGRYSDGRPHNHGTAWRIKKENIPELYAYEIDLLKENIPKNINCNNPIITEEPTYKRKYRKITDYFSVLLF